MTSEEVTELARSVAELAASLQTQGDRAEQNSQALERLFGSLGQVAQLIEDLQERVSILEGEASRENQDRPRTRDR